MPPRDQDRVGRRPAAGRAVTVRDTTGIHDLWVPHDREALLIGALDQCGGWAVGGTSVVVLDPDRRPRPTTRRAGGVRAVTTAPERRSVVELVVDWLPGWAALLAAMMPWPAGTPVPVVAAGAAVVVAWWARCAGGAGEPRWNVWLAMGSAVLLAGLAGRTVGELAAPATGARVAGLVLVVGSLHLLAAGPWLVWRPPEGWLLEPRLLGGQPDRSTGDRFSPAGRLPAADRALRRLTLLAGTASLVGAFAVLPARGPVTEPASVVVTLIATLVWLSRAGRTRGPDLARVHTGVAVGLLSVVVVTAPGPGRAWVPLVAGMGLGLVALVGGRVWDLLWWPAAHPRLNRWLLAAALPGAVAASGIVEFLTRTG